jgi:hypothetical protein
VISGERGGQRIGPPLPIHLFGNVSLRNWRTANFFKQFEDFVDILYIWYFTIGLKTNHATRTQRQIQGNILE